MNKNKKNKQENEETKTLSEFLKTEIRVKVWQLLVIGIFFIILGVMLK